MIDKKFKKILTPKVIKEFYHKFLDTNNEINDYDNIIDQLDNVILKLIFQSAITCNHDYKKHVTFLIDLKIKLTLNLSKSKETKNICDFYKIARIFLKNHSDVGIIYHQMKMGDY